MVGINNTRAIRKNWGKTYKPGTFGVEIEYRVNDEDDHDSDIDYDSAREVFNRQVDHPPSPSEWEEDNEEPKKPDEDDYTWSDDYMTNYSNFYKEFGMEKVSVFPLDTGEFVNTNLLNVFEDHWVKRQYIDMIVNFRHLWDYGTDGTYKKKMFFNEANFEKFYKDKKMSLNYLFPDKLEQQISSARHTAAQGSYRFTDEQREVGNKIVQGAYKVLDKFMEYHHERAKEITEEEFNEEMTERYENDLEEWKDKHSDWQAERDEIEERWQAYDEDAAFDRWLNRNIDSFTNERPHRDVADEIDEMDSWFRSQGLKTKSEKGDDEYSSWNIFEDEDGIVEISSPILNASNFGVLKKIFAHIRDNKEMDSGTGLHVHIGMPGSSDIFDALCMAYLTDEEAIVGISGREEESLRRYANRKDSLFGNLFNALQDGVYTSGKFILAISGKNSTTGMSHITRYQGVNFFRAFQEMGTVEFRYLTSQALNNENELLKTINYMLMLPRIAHGRSQIRYDIPGKGTIVLSRRPGGQIEVKKFEKGKVQSVPKSPEPVSQLRQPEQPLKDRLMSKFRPQQVQNQEPTF